MALRTAANNPFTPGFDDAEVWVDRPEELATVHAMVRRAQQGSLQSPRLVEQERGYGKTTLLRAIADRFDGDWESTGVTVHVTAVKGEPFLASLTAGLNAALRRATPFGEEVATRLVSALGRIREVRLAGVVEVTVGDEGSEMAPSLAVTEALEDLGRTARDADLTVLLLVDEAHSIDGASLRALFTALQTVTTARDEHGLVPPIATILAGLPGTRAAFKRHHVTFGERARDLPLGRLDDEAVRATLLRFHAFNDQGVTFAPDAVERMVDQVEGHPHVLQLVGEGAWVASPDASTITVADVDTGAGTSRRERAAIANARLADLTDAQRGWARAAAALPADERTLTAICRRYRDDDAATAANCGSLADALFDKGVVRRGDDGRIEFTLRAIEAHLAP